MSENNIKHFETLWEESEKLTENMYKDIPTDKLVEKIAETLASYSEAGQIESKEISDSLKSKLIGEAVFMITAISLRDNINVYAALQECCTLHNAVSALV